MPVTRPGMLADHALCTGTPHAWPLGTIAVQTGARPAVWCRHRQTPRAALLEVEVVVVRSVLCVVQIATDQVARALKVNQGALIQAVAPRGAADTAGLQPTRRQEVYVHISVRSNCPACALHSAEGRRP